MPDSLTKRQKQTLDHITRAIQREGYPPSIREIGHALGIKSPRGVVGHLEALQKKGYLSRERGARTIKIISPPQLGPTRHVSRRAQKFRAAGSPRVFAGPWERIGSASGNAPYSIPLLGAIAAGRPILAEENFEDSLLVDERFASGKNIFALRIKGKSMIDAGIFDGDYVLVRQQPKVDDGEIAAVLLDDEATVKRVHCRRGMLRLVSENPAMAPIEVGENEKRVQILGKVVGVMRKI